MAKTQLTVDIERVRELAFERGGDEDPLAFFEVARELGAEPKEARLIDEILTERMLRAGGVI